MTISEGIKRIDDLKKLANNVRLITQYFLNEAPSKLEEIAEKHGIDSPIKNVMSAATEEMYALAESAEKALNEAIIENPTFPLDYPDTNSVPSDGPSGVDTAERGVFMRNGVETHYA